MKQLKTIVAFVAGLFAFTSVQAGEMTVTGSMQATYQSEVDDVTGNPLGMNTDLTFTGNYDSDFGAITWTMGTDGVFLGESSADHKLSLATGLGTFTIGNTGDAADAVDDITPSAFEEANGSGSGTYSTDIGIGSGTMNLAYSNGDIMGTGISVKYNYYPQLSGQTENEKASSATDTQNRESAESINVGIPFSGLPIIGDSPIGGAKITLGYSKAETTLANTQHQEGGTGAIVLPVGPLKIGYQKKAYQAFGTSAAEAQDGFFKDDIVGIAYAINDELAISYNRIQSDKHLHTAGEVEQETKALNLAYTVGGLTLGFQDAKTTNAGYTSGSDDDTRTLSIKTGF